MLKNYIKIAWRNILRNKLYSLINIGGLAIGMAISFVLLLYVYNEFSFDRFNVNKDNLYQVFRNQPNNGEIKTRPFTQYKLGEILKQNFPEVVNTAHTSEPADILMKFKDNGIKVSTLTTDPALLDMFTFDFIAGNKASLSEPESIVITESVAKAIFGDTDPVGQVIRYADTFPLKVTAVIKDNPRNSNFAFKALISWKTLVAHYNWMGDAGMSNYSYYTYVQLKPGIDFNSVNPKIKNLLGKYSASEKEVKLFLYPYTRLHLHSEFKNGVNSGGSIEYVRLFLFLAIGILLIACINFMNLATARSGKRAREIGVRKAIGAQRWSLIKQFMSESLAMVSLSLIIAIGLMCVLLPVFNASLGTLLVMPFGNVGAWLAALSVTLLTGLLAGAYPAIFLSSFKAVNVLKGQVINPQATVRPRQVLVVVQFTFAICLILFSITIYKQINYIKDRPVGYNRGGLIEMPLDGSMYGDFERFRQEAIDIGAITDGAKTSSKITFNDAFVWNVNWPGQVAGEEKIPFDCMAVTYHFINTYGLKLIEGRDFSKDFLSDSTGIILNEASVKLMRLKNPIGQRVKWMDKNCTVVGVVKNFVWSSPYEPVKPAIIGFSKDWVGSLGLRLNPNAPVSQSLDKLQQLYKKYNPAYQFEYSFTDDNFRLKFNNERLLGTMSAGFTLLAIMISCLGLFALAAFSAERRSKEIGIRKIMGASISSLWFTLSGEFAKLVLISFIIGSAISWFSIGQWLTKYTYHTSISVWMFVATMLISLLICFITVSWQAVKAAFANPVKSLRSE